MNANPVLLDALIAQATQAVLFVTIVQRTTIFKIILVLFVLQHLRARIVLMDYYVINVDKDILILNLAKLVLVTAKAVSQLICAHNYTIHMDTCLFQLVPLLICQLPVIQAV
jgi:hypothetical protein